MLLSFSTLVLHNSTMFFMIESFLLCHQHMLVRIFIIMIENLPQKLPKVFVSKQVGCTPTSFPFELSHTYSSSASLVWQSLLIHIDIYQWASSQPIDTPSQCDHLLLFCLTTTTTLYSTYSAIYTAHAHVLRDSYQKFEKVRVQKQLLGQYWGCP